MKYIRVLWLHDFSQEPVEIFSEIDDEGYERRKVEVFADGTIGFATESQHIRSTELGEKPIPNLLEIAADAQFKPTLITQEDFERIWADRFSSKANA